MTVPAGALDLRPSAPRAQRMVVSRLERALVDSMRVWALRSVRAAKLDRIDLFDAAPSPVDVWLVR